MKIWKHVCSLFLLSFVLFCAKTSFAVVCDFDSDCPDPQYQFCKKPIGFCGDIGIGTVSGTCETIPDPGTMCPTVYTPVCACNGVTYPNSCDASVAGVNLDFNDECTPLIADSDRDGVPDANDRCPGFPDRRDADGDGVPDGCDLCLGNNISGDSDEDGICNDMDICIGNDVSGDTDGDGICNDRDPQTCGNGIVEAPEACDDINLENWDSCSKQCQLNQITHYVIDDGLLNQSEVTTSGGIDGQGVGGLLLSGSFQMVVSGSQVKFTSLNVIDAPPEGFVFPEYPGSFDGVNFSGVQTNGAFPINTFEGDVDFLYGTDFISMTGEYHQPYYDGYIYNFSLLGFIDTDADEWADIVDVFPNDPNEWADIDNDGIGDNNDICLRGDNNLDADTDGVPDACDACSGNDATGDPDSDGLCTDSDNCPSSYNPGQDDVDGDGLGDACDTFINPKAGSVIDAPHNETFGIYCKDCHSYSTWWAYSPTASSSSPSHNEISDGICNNCHDRQIPFVSVGMAHAGDGTDPSSHVFTTTCTDCHDPHKQSQLDWIDPDPLNNEPFLVTGSIDTVTYDDLARSTDIVFSGFSPISANWNDQTKWSKKSTTSSYDRGLILVVDTQRAENTYVILSSVGDTITVQGQVDGSYAGNTFGLIYGQFIRQKVRTLYSGEKDVKFFEPDGGFVEEVSSEGPLGLCQVCHDSTGAYNTSGTLPSVGDLNHGDIPDGDCTICHQCGIGFGIGASP